MPAITGGNDTIFDIWPSKIEEAARKDWMAKKFTALRKNGKDLCGAAFEAYIEFLVEKDLSDLVDEIENSMAEFDRALDLKSDVGGIRHAAKNFSLIYAGGVLAIGAGLLPVTNGRLLKSIVTCFRDGLLPTARPKELEGNALKQLIAGLKNTTLPEKADLKPGGDPVGFRRAMSSSDARIMFAIKPACFERWFADPPRCQSALRWMDADKLLQLRAGTTLPFGAINTENVVTFEKRKGKDGNREQGRWIRFLDPRPTVG